MGADASIHERDGRSLWTQAKTQRDIIELFRASILPKSVQALEAATSDYQAGNVDYVTLITAWREVLQIQLQIAQVETELGKALASLERAVGVQLNQHPPGPPPTAPNSTAIPIPCAATTGCRGCQSLPPTVAREPRSGGRWAEYETGPAFTAQRDAERQVAQCELNPLRRSVLRHGHGGRAAQEARRHPEGIPETWACG